MQHAKSRTEANLGPDCIVSKDKGFREPRCYILSLKTAGEGLGAAEIRTKIYTLFKDCWEGARSCGGSNMANRMPDRWNILDRSLTHFLI